MTHPLPCMEHCDVGLCTKRTSSTGRIPPAHHCARGHISSTAPAAKFHWEATNTYLPSRRYSVMAVGVAAAAFQVAEEQKGQIQESFFTTNPQELTPWRCSGGGRELRPFGEALGEEGSSSSELAFAYSGLCSPTAL